MCDKCVANKTMTQEELDDIKSGIAQTEKYDKTLTDMLESVTCKSPMPVLDFLLMHTVAWAKGHNIHPIELIERMMQAGGGNAVVVDAGSLLDRIEAGLGLHNKSFVEDKEKIH